MPSRIVAISTRCAVSRDMPPSDGALRSVTLSTDSSRETVPNRSRARSRRTQLRSDRSSRSRRPWPGRRPSPSTSMQLASSSSRCFLEKHLVKQHGVSNHSWRGPRSPSHVSTIREDSCPASWSAHRSASLHARSVPEDRATALSTLQCAEAKLRERIGSSESCERSRKRTITVSKSRLSHSDWIHDNGAAIVVA